MKKSSVFALLVAGAATTSFADIAQTNATWFTGIGSGVTALDNLNTKASNGEWNVGSSGLTADNASISDGKLVLDLDTSDEALFSITNAGESATEQQVAVTAVFTPCQPSELTAGSALVTKGAQVAFAVVNTATDVYKYYAWVGASGGASAINDWVQLVSGDTTDIATANIGNAISLKIDLAYWVSTATATFTVGDDQIGDEQTLTTSKRLFSSVACAGSGTITSVNGQYTYGVAQYTVGDVVYKFPTANSAIEAVKGITGTKPTVDLIHNASGDIAVDPAVAVNTNGKEANLDPGDSADQVEVKLPSEKVSSGSGTYVLDVSTKKGADKFVITSTDTSKEVSVTTNENGKLVATVQTSSAILNAVKPDGSKALTVNANYRAFLAKHGGTAYTQAETTSSAIQTQLQTAQTGDDKNGLALWQDYVLGIEPTTSIKPLPTTGADSAADGITLKIPGIDTTKYSGDYTVTYKVGDNEVSSPSAIKVPLTTGNHDVKIILK